MPTPNFPTTLPNVLMSNYSFTPVDGNLRTEMDTGLQRVRRRFVSTPTDINVAWEFTREELGIFEKFFQEDIYGGAAWFIIKLVNGTGEADYTARFKGPYQASTSAREFYWSVTATLEVAARPMPVV